jgi:hypothetical protein
MAWNVLEIVTIDNASYHETIQVYELPRCLQFELDTRKTPFCNLSKAIKNVVRNYFGLF